MQRTTITHKEKPETIHYLLTANGAWRKKPAPASVVATGYVPYRLKTRFLLSSRLLRLSAIMQKPKFDRNDKVIAKDLKLSPLVKNPLKAKSYNSLINSCLKVDNLDAHFIKGVLQFFDSQNKSILLTKSSKALKINNYIII